MKSAIAEAYELERKLSMMRAQKGLLAYVLATNPAYEVNWHHRRLCQAINAMNNGWTHRQLLALWGINGRVLEHMLAVPHPTTGLFAGMTHPDVIDHKLRNLHIAVPPRCGKTTLASMAMPAWWLGKNPDTQIISASYSAALASKINRAVQREIDCEAYKSIFPATKLNAKNVKTVAQNSYLRNSEMFEIVGRKGIYRSAGVSGGVTGMGADCLDGRTQVAVPGGTSTLEEVVDRGVGSLVVGYDHATKSTKVCRVLAVRRVRTTSICRVRTSAGHEFECTPEHMVWERNVGYRQAKGLGPGAELIAIEAAGQKEGHLPGLQRRDKKLQRDMQQVLQGAPARDGPVSVLQLRQSIHPAHVRVPEVLKSRQDFCFLRFGLSQQSAQYQENDSVRGVWMCHARQGECLVLSGLPPRRRFCVEGQSAGLQHVVSAAAAVDFTQRQIYVRGMQKARGTAHNVRAPYRRSANQPRHSQFDNTVFALPQPRAQTKHVTIDTVESYSCAPRYVYDIQVEGCGNFFAAGILVSNCAIIDDPVKSRETADSPVIRETVWEWYASTLYTRLHKGAVKCLIMTRWHEDDLGGRILQKAKSDPSSDQWFACVYPAILDQEPTPGDPRSVGEVLWPDHFPLNQIETTKATIGTYEFEALYQQRPAPTEGGIVKTAWLQYYTRLPDDLKNYTLSADLTFGNSKAGNTGDFVAIQMWAAQGAHRFLVDQIHGRMEFTEQLRAIKTMCAKYPQCRVKLIEDAANGRALISLLRKEIQGLIAVPPSGSKSARLEAVSPQMEAGNVYLPSPDIAPWVQGLVHELASFPNAAHDDQVDALSQGLWRMRATGSYLVGTAPGSITRASAWLGPGGV